MSFDILYKVSLFQKYFYNIVRITPLNKKQQINFDEREFKIPYHNFISINTNKNSLIEFDFAFDVPEVFDNPIIQRIIIVFDKNGDGKISFYEFVCGLRTLTNNANIEEKLNFVFQTK